MNVQQMLHRRATTDRQVLVEGNTGLGVSWSDVDRLAHCWASSGLRGPVGLAIADPVVMAANFVAALAAGATVAPLDPSAPPRDLATRVRELGLTAVVTDAPCGASSPTIWTPTPDGVRIVAEKSRPTPAAGPAVIMTSSGTTGPPKIIPLTEVQLITTAEAVARHLRLGEGEIGYSPLPLFHINGLVVGVLSSLVAGSSLVLERRFSRRSFWEVVEQRAVTWLNLVPAIIAALADGADAPDPQDLTTRDRVRLARSASAPLPESVRIRFESRHAIPVIEAYGMTEAASQITANPLASPRPRSVGLPVGVQLRIVGAHGQPLPPDHDGRVQIRGRAVTDVYWEKTGSGGWNSVPAVTPSGWLTTGDVGHLDTDGYVYLVGREGDVINRGGEKIRPREVEDLLLADSRVRSAVVVGRPHATLGEEPVAFVLAHDAPTRIEAARLAADLADRCTRALSRYKRPAEICVTESLPAGPTGKVRRAEVRQMAAAGSGPAAVRSLS
jgi:oxalate---CoA ligase